MVNNRCDSNGPTCRRTRFLLLLVSLLALIVLEPLLYDFTRLRFLLEIFLSVILFASIYAVSQKKTETLMAFLLAIPKLATLWALSIIPNPLLAICDSIFGIIFIAYIAVLILAHIFRQDEVTLEMIYGAIVVYILIGVLWFFLYQLTEVMHPQSFTFSMTPGDDMRKTLQYFSFVTLTTLGYGDVFPVSGPAKSLTTLEAIVGQMYIAVLIARLVGIHIAQTLMKK